MEHRTSRPRPSRRARRVRSLGWLTGALVAFAVLGYSGIAIVSAHLLTKPSHRPSRIDPRQIGPAVDWRAKTEDGLTLRGWYFPTPERRRLIVGVHGMTMNWEELAGVGRDLHRRGYDVLLFDLRGHGRSDSARLSMGRHERNDLRAVLHWAKAEGFEPDQIGWIGASMGGSTILLEGLRNGEIAAAVLDSPYADLPELLDRQLTEFSGLPPVFNPGIVTAAHLVYDVRTDDLVLPKLADRWGNRPLLIIHGEADAIVPVHHGRALAKAVGAPCSLVTIPGTGHVGSYHADPIGYVNRVDRFFREHLRE